MKTKTKKISSNKPREHWVRPWLQNRQQLGCCNSLFQELMHDEKAFKKFIRMEKSQFEFLVGKVQWFLKRILIWENVSNHMKWSAWYYVVWGVEKLSDRLNSSFALGKRAYLALLLMFAEQSLRFWCRVTWIRLETLKNSWRFLRSSTKDGTSRMVLVRSTENILLWNNHSIQVPTAEITRAQIV